MFALMSGHVDTKVWVSLQGNLRVIARVEVCGYAWYACGCKPKCVSMHEDHVSEI